MREKHARAEEEGERLLIPRHGKAGEGKREQEEEEKGGGWGVGENRGIRLEESTLHREEDGQLPFRAFWTSLRVLSSAVTAHWTLRVHHRPHGVTGTSHFLVLAHCNVSTHRFLLLTGPYVHLRQHFLSFTSCQQLVWSSRSRAQLIVSGGEGDMTQCNSSRNTCTVKKGLTVCMFGSSAFI